MRIMVLTGSPHQQGSSNLLAEYFIRGAREAGNMVGMVDVAHLAIRPCNGCLRCGYNGPCMQKDDMEKLRSHILETDMLVFVTPVYYYGMTAQLKTVIDRFCAFNAPLQQKHMKSALISVAWNSDDRTFAVLDAHYKSLVQYLGFTDMGTVYGRGCGSPDVTARSVYVRQAYELGRKLVNQTEQ